MLVDIGKKKSVSEGAITPLPYPRDPVHAI